MSTEPSASTPRTYALRTLGCKVAQHDAAAFSNLLEAAGAAPADPSVAELVVVSACSVTARADRDALRLIRRLRRQNPHARLVVRGCLARRIPAALSAMSEVDEVGEGGPFPETLSLEQGRAPGGDRPAPGPAAGRTRVFLKVQDGCGRRCAYCVVPSLRGPERSVAPDDVVRAVHAAGESGVPEVVLVGVHLASYGRDRGTTLLSLLTRLENDPPPCRVRLSSLEPMDAGSELVALVGGSRVLAPHLHFPLQSGSDAVLHRMKRGLTAARFADLVTRAASARPGIHVGTDVIAGFPGETAAEFRETEALLETLPLASLHAFSFSPRPGTEGARLHAAAPVPAAVVARRAARLREIGREKALAFRIAAHGTTQDVVALARGRGLTGSYLEVLLEEGASGIPRRGARFTGVVSWDPGRLVLTAIPSGPPAC